MKKLNLKIYISFLTGIIKTTYNNNYINYHNLDKITEMQGEGRGSRRELSDEGRETWDDVRNVTINITCSNRFARWKLRREWERPRGIRLRYFLKLPVNPHLSQNKNLTQRKCLHPPFKPNSKSDRVILLTDVLY